MYAVSVTPIVRRRVSGLVRGVEVQVAGGHQERARLTKAAVQEQALWTARAGQVPPPGQTATQPPPNAGRKAGTWGGVEDVGHKAREVDRARQRPDHERTGERQGLSMGQ